MTHRNAIRRNVLALLSVAVCCLSMGLHSTARGTDVVTGLVMIEGFRDAIESSASQLRGEAQLLMIDAFSHANSMVDRLERMMGENIGKPVGDLNETIQNEIAAMEFLLKGLQSTVDQLPRCVGNEADIAIAGFKNGIQSALSNIPFVDGDPIAYLIKQPSNRSPYTIVRDKSKTQAVSIEIIGANMWDKSELCDISATATPFDDAGAPFDIEVLLSDKEKISLGMKPDIPNGEWLVEIEAKRRADWMGCIWPDTESVFASMKVVEPTVADVVVELTPSCKQYEECRFEVSGSCTSESTRSDKNCPAVYKFEDGECELLEFVGFQRGGRDGNTTNPSLDFRTNTVTIIGTANRRGKLEGGKSRYWWKGTMIGRKEIEPSVLDPISIPIEEPIRKDHSVEFTLPNDSLANCEIDLMTVEGNASFSDEKKVALPGVNVGPGRRATTTAGGIGITYNAVTGRGTVEHSAAGCLAN